MSIDERLEALTMSLELQHREGESQRERIEAQSRGIETLSRGFEVLSRNISQLRELIEIDAENIRALARIRE